MRYMLHDPFQQNGEWDDFFKRAVEEVVQYDRASASLLQRRLDIGYARAARILDQLAAAGVVGPQEGSKPREVLNSSPQELFGENWEKLPKKEDREIDVWPPEPPANYKIPSGVKLSNVTDIPWSVQFSDTIKRPDFRDLKIEFPIPLGLDAEGNLKTESLLEVNNLIIAGNTLSQKENLVDTILLTYLLRYDPQNLKLILIDPTHYLDLYDGIIHLLSPVINEHDKIISALRWTLAELDRRLKGFSEKGVRDIDAFNRQHGFEALPRILVVTFPDFFDVEIEDALVRLAAQGMRTGIHNIMVVDHTSGAGLPRMIKDNIPARVVFRMSSAGEARAIEVAGAEKLEPGEIIYKPNFGESRKLKAIFTPETNVKEVVQATKQH
jgi:DNA segregation ATPase FtsK/SpoIIIE, S-DNA-T family